MMIPEFYKNKGVTSKQWSDWQWQLTNNITKFSKPGFDNNFKIIKNKTSVDIHFLSDITGKTEIQPDVV